MATYRRALQIQPNSYESSVNLAEVLLDLQQSSQAHLLLNQAITVAPRRMEAYLVLARAARESGSIDAALEALDAAQQVTPTSAEPRFLRSLVALEHGDYATGWRDYEARWQTEVGSRDRRLLPQPVWQGEPLSGKSILVHGEQGLGDEIMFASCLPDLLAEAAHCVIASDRLLAPLLSRSFPDATVRPLDMGAPEWTQLAREPVDVQIAAGSVPRYLRPTRGSFPRHEGYLRADPLRTAAWSSRLGLGTKRAIGFAWRAGRGAHEQRRRSLSLVDLEGLIRLSGNQSVCLQHDATPDELAQFVAWGGIIGEFEVPSPSSLDEMAACIAALDAVVTVAGTVAHLAGALGCPAWCLVRAGDNWRWLWQQCDSPWYPSLRVLHASSSGMVSSLIDGVRDQLQKPPR